MILRRVEGANPTFEKKKKKSPKPHKIYKILCIWGDYESFLCGFSTVNDTF